MSTQHRIPTRQNPLRLRRLLSGPDNSSMASRHSPLASTVCAALLTSLCCAQQTPSTPADSSDARKLLELSQAAAQARLWAEEARNSVAAADHALKWLRPVLAEHQRATQSLESGKLLEVAEWIDTWAEDLTEWVWWFDASKFRQSSDGVWDLANRRSWSIMTETELQTAAEQSGASGSLEALQSAKQSMLHDLRRLHAQLCTEDPRGNQYRPWIKICSEPATPDSLQTTLHCTAAWIEADVKALELREANRLLAQAAAENTRIQAEAQKALTQAKDAMPKLKQRATETSEWAKEAREGEDYNKIRVADEAKEMAAAELNRCEKQKERATATIAECATDAKEHEAQKKQFAAEISAADADIKAKHAAATKAWTELVAAIAARTKSLEEQSKKGHDDAALLDQAAWRWLQEAKDVARAKGR